MPAVLQRPHPVRAQAPSPEQYLAEPAPADPDGLLAEHLTRRGGDARDRVRALVRVRTEHDHEPCPPLLPLKWTAGGHGLLGALPRTYQVTPDIPDRRRATQQKEVRPTGRQPQRESARRRSGPSPQRRTSPTRHQNSKPQSSIERPGNEWSPPTARGCGSALRRERLLQVAPEVVRMLAANAKPEEAGR